LASRLHTFAEGYHTRSDRARLALGRKRPVSFIHVTSAENSLRL